MAAEKTEKARVAHRSSAVLISHRRKLIVRSVSMLGDAARPRDVARLPAPGAVAQAWRGSRRRPLLRQSSRVSRRFAPLSCPVLFAQQEVLLPAPSSVVRCLLARWARTTGGSARR